MYYPKGIVAPLVTPLDSEERLEVPTLHRLLDLIVPELDAVFLLGSSGEFAALKEETAQQLVDVALEHIGGRVPVLVGISDAGTARAIQNLKRLEHTGAAAVVATSPYYYPLTDQESLVSHFFRIAEASPLPLVLYNIPQNTAINLSPASVRRLAQHPNIIGMKDSWGDMILFQEFLKATGAKFSLLQGREQLTAISLWLGGAGVVSTVGNFAPGLLQKVYKAVQRGDHDSARAAQIALSDLARVFDYGYWLAAMKTVLAEMGIGDGRMAAPFPQSTPEQRACIRRVLQEHGLVPK